MTSLSIAPEDEGGSAYGKTVSELQSGIQISADNKISGTLYWVKNFTGYSPVDNSGNFLALKVDYPEEAETEVTIIGGTTKNLKMPKGDHQLVVKVKDAAAQKIQIGITTEGKTGSVTYDLSGLTLKPDEAA